MTAGEWMVLGFYTMVILGIGARVGMLIERRWWRDRVKYRD